MRNRVRLFNYGNYSSDNYGSCRAIQIGTLTLYFSYETVIAFQEGFKDLVIRENDWGPTTGKHLNWICKDKSIRISGKEFEEKLEEVLKEHNLEV